MKKGWYETANGAQFREIQSRCTESVLKKEVRGVKETVEGL